MQEKRISATEFKAKCLSLLDEVATNGRSILVTKRGKPVARVTKVVRDVRPAMDGMKGTAREVGDIVHFDTTDLWECLK